MSIVVNAGVDSVTAARFLHQCAGLYLLRQLERGGWRADTEGANRGREQLKSLVSTAALANMLV